MHKQDSAAVEGHSLQANTSQVVRPGETAKRK